MFEVDHATAAETAASIGDGPITERVLVVEDDRATRYGLTELVRSWGYLADGAADGEEALQKVTTFRPAIIISDLVMPRMDGLALLRSLRDQLSDIVIILLTAQGSVETAVEAIKEAKRRGFRVTTNSTFFNTDTPQTIIEVLNFLNDDLKVDEMMISPAYAYEKAPDQEHFLGVEQTRELFKKAFAGGNRRKWRLNHSPLFLDFLEGKVDFPCTAWAIPNYSLFGWQRPCYLLAEGYAASFKDLMEQTDWDSYGTGNYEKCADCMAHCGYEATAVKATMQSPLEGIRAGAGALLGRGAQ